MLKKFIFPICLFLLYTANAQISQKITIKAGEDLSEALATHGLYVFASFKRADVKFKDGTSTTALLNYNVYLNDMEFIDNKGDTLVIDKPALIDSIKFDSAVFYYDRGYVRVMEDYGSTKFAMRSKTSFQNIKNGAFGQHAPGAGIETYGRMPTYLRNTNQLILNEDIVVKTDKTYYIIFRKFHQVNANYSGFAKAFPDAKEKIQGYVDTEKINFDSEADLKKLFVFCVENSQK